MSGYAGVFFLDLFDSSLMATSVDARYVFFAMIMLGDEQGDGTANMPAERLAARIALPLDRLLRAIEELEAPDPDSRIDVEDGRRIVPLDRGPGFRHRGWRVVNWLFYKELAAQKGRRASNREAAKAYRERHRSSSPVIGASSPVIKSKLSAQGISAQGISQVTLTGEGSAEGGTGSELKPGFEPLPGESHGAPGALSRPEETGAETLGDGAPIESSLGEISGPGGSLASMEGTDAQPPFVAIEERPGNLGSRISEDSISKTERLKREQRAKILAAQGISR